MCKHGKTVPVMVTIPNYLSHTGKERREAKEIDVCIAELVAALSEYGILTTGSCCGHHVQPGSILLGDGRELRIHKSRAIDAALSDGTTNG